MHNYFPLGKYSYLCLPIGAPHAPDVFQDQNRIIIPGFRICTSLHRWSTNCLMQHTWRPPNQAWQGSTKATKRGLRINAPKSRFATDNIDYLGYTLTQCGIKPQEQKVSAILALLPPTNVKQLRWVLGIIQFYRDIWEKRTDLLAPLTDLVGECGTTKPTKKTGTKRLLGTGIISSENPSKPSKL